MNTRKEFIGSVAAWTAAGFVPVFAREDPPELVAAKKWFHEAQFGMMCCFGLYSVLGGEWKGRRIPNPLLGEWVQQYFRIPVAEYEKVAAAFNPIYFNADEWMKLAADAGMKYLVFTAKFHDGFAMFRSKVSRISGGIVALALLACGVWISIPVFSAHEWKEWSPTAMQDALDEGRPVYVDFTAKWCATCQSNKKLAYTDEVYKAFADHGVVLMRADKTKPSEEIDAAMRKLNRSSVPVNVLYIPDREPAVTSELLTAPYMLDFLNEQFKAAEEAKKTQEAEEAEEEEEAGAADEEV